MMSELCAARKKCDGGRHDPRDLIALFDALFAASCDTRLRLGGKEPEYLPKGGAAGCHQIFFAHGFFASALHEVAHWCVAGAARRLEPDYGYWYRPDGRSAAEQLAFAQVEVKPQALEWIFATAAGSAFHFSADNLAPGGAVVTAEWRQFQAAVLGQVRTYISRGLPTRAALFSQRLAAFYGTAERYLEAAAYTLE